MRLKSGEEGTISLWWAHLTEPHKATIVVRYECIFASSWYDDIIYCKLRFPCSYQRGYVQLFGDTLVFGQTALCYFRS